MASRSESRTTTRSKAPSNRSARDNRGAFSWSSGGAIAGAALGGAALALAANLGRKLAVQGISAAKGNWAEGLAAEHKAVLALFDKMLETDESQTMQRKLMLMKLSHALDKHAYAEEHVVYAALRETGSTSDAETLENDHGEVKEFLYRLSHMDADTPEWLSTIRQFRDAVSAHAKMEEDMIFPQLRADISDEMDARITAEVNKAGFMMA